jgi:hypothetical protein
MRRARLDGSTCTSSTFDGFRANPENPKHDRPHGPMPVPARQGLFYLLLAIRQRTFREGRSRHPGNKSPFRCSLHHISTLNWKTSFPERIHQKIVNLSKDIYKQIFIAISAEMFRDGQARLPRCLATKMALFTMMGKNHEAAAFLPRSG